MRAAFAAFNGGFRRSSKEAPDRELVLQPGKQITDKELQSLYNITTASTIGTSNTAKVHAAVELASGDPCAVKIVLRTTFAKHPSLLRSLRAEASLAESFPMQCHPNIVMPLKVSETRTQVLVEMDMAGGGDLASLLLAIYPRKWHDESHPARIIVQLLRGVEYCHSNNVIHGDIKPENVLLTRRPPTDVVDAEGVFTAPGCIYKLCDFGNAQILPQTEPATTAVVAGMVGTPGYMAPEVMGEGVVMKESDMWSVGVLIYVTLTGEMIYSVGNDDQEAAFYSNPKKYLRTLPRWKKIGRVWRRLMTELLVTNPADRLSVGAALQAECLPGRESGKISE